MKKSEKDEINKEENTKIPKVKKESKTDEKVVAKSKSLKTDKEEKIDSKSKSKKSENKMDKEREKVLNIVKKAKQNGKITYAELASELGEINPERLDKVFETFEELGIKVSKDEEDMMEPDENDLKEVERSPSKA